MSNKIEEILKIPSMDSFLFYKIKEGKLAEHSGYFKPKNTIIKISDKFKSIKEMSLSGAKIFVNDIDYDDVLYADKKIEIIYEAPDKNYSREISVNEIEFDRKEGGYYVFYLSLIKSEVKLFFEEIIDSQINNEKIDILKKVEYDEI